MKLIFLDIDGTIYGPEQILHPELKLKIMKAINEKSILCIATGNAPFIFTKKLSKELGIKYLIHSNGAGMIDIENDKIIYKKVIGIKAANKLLKIANKFSIHANWWNDSFISCNIFYIKNIKWIIEKKTLLNTDLVQVQERVEYPIYKMEFYNKDIIKMEELQLEIEELGLSVSRTSPFHIEVTNKGITKKEGVEFICNLYKTDPKYVMAIGDSNNDVAMLKIVGFSYSMGNASDEAKKWAKFSTLSYKQNGVGIAIEHYLKSVKKQKNTV